jgi:proline iminopeptidase
LERLLFAACFSASLMILCHLAASRRVALIQVSILIATPDFKQAVLRVIPIKTTKGIFKVWTKRIGNNPKIKVLMLTGGPGASHEYMECFENFFPKEGIEFIYYDQLGTGNSEVPKDASLYDLDRSVDEVEQVRKALHLSKDNFFLYGHSWGGIVALDYALKYQQNLKALIISDMMSSASDYNQYAKDVLAKQIDRKSIV